MNLIQYSIVDYDDAVDEIEAYIKVNYNKKHVEVEADNLLSRFFEDLKENLSVFIEYPYVDKVYRDSYYTYFSSKHNHYYRDCIRVSFFDNVIKPEDFRLKNKVDYLQKHFLGFLIIRPTFPKIIGRSHLNKRAFKKDNFITCQVKENVLINGLKLDVYGFPHSSQDIESISCAETTLWAMMEYFGNRYADYRPTLPSQILSVLNRNADQRLLPSNGLTVEQISYALKEFGFGAYVYSKEAYKAELTNIIATYIESGIPIVAVIQNESGDVGHAAVIMGHENDTKIDFRKVKARRDFKNEIKYIDYTDIKQKYVIQDDNLTPYKLVDLEWPVEHYVGVDDSFLDCTIEAVIVPLYKKIYLEADKAKKLALYILKDHYFGHDFDNNFVFRFYLASSRSFKSHIATLNRLEKNVKEALIQSKMPKFIWCAEIYQQTDFNKNKAIGLVILDATEASENKGDALIFAGYPSKCWLRIEKEFVPLEKSFNIYNGFKNNLN